MAEFDRLLHNIDMIHQIHSGFYTRCTPDWAWSVDSMPDYDLWFVSSGKGSIALNGITFPIGTGDALLLPPGSRVRGRQDLTDRLSVYAVHFLPDSDESVQEIAGRPVRMEQSVFLLELFQRFFREQNRSSGRTELWLEAILEEIRYQAAGLAKTGSAYNRGAVRDLCSRIRENPAESRPVSQMAEKLSVCPDHFIRIFKEETGMTPRQYIIENRLNMAQHLLLESDLSVGRISELCGFESPQWFCRLFHQKRGISPGTYRTKTG